MEQQMLGGYHGKVLRVDLTREKMTTVEIDEGFCRKYLGGAGFVAHYSWLKSTRVLTLWGLKTSSSSRLALLPVYPWEDALATQWVEKSPLTGGVAKAEVGEHWGSQLKRAGFDAVIIEGKAKSPIYLHIYGGKATLRDARHLWGKSTKETQESIRAELADSKVRVAMIGPGGENQVKYACIMHGPFDAAGRGG